MKTEHYLIIGLAALVFLPNIGKVLSSIASGDILKGLAHLIPLPSGISGNDLRDIDPERYDEMVDEYGLQPSTTYPTSPGIVAEVINGPPTRPDVLQEADEIVRQSERQVVIDPVFSIADNPQQPSDESVGDTVIHRIPYRYGTAEIYQTPTSISGKPAGSDSVEWNYTVGTVYYDAYYAKLSAQKDGIDKPFNTWLCIIQQPDRNPTFRELYDKYSPKTWND